MTKEKISNEKGRKRKFKKKSKERQRGVYE
jgi:hypothetical protein